MIAMIAKYRFTLQMNVARKKMQAVSLCDENDFEVIKNLVQPDARISFLKGLAMTLQLSSNSWPQCGLSLLWPCEAE